MSNNHNNRTDAKNFVGELLGTFILVLFGTGIIGVSVLFRSELGLFHVAALWGSAVALGIYASRHLSDAHLNPAVSIAMTALGRLPARKLLFYLPAQFLGAFLASAVVYLLFSGPLRAYETANGIVRGAPESVRTAVMFGAYFPNPAIGYAVGAWEAAFAEALGTFLLVMMALLILEKITADLSAYIFSPIFIGVAVASIVSIVAPVSSSGINPARDFGPRLFSYLAGWGTVAIPGPNGNFFLVYFIAPIVGALLAAGVFAFAVRPLIFQHNMISHVKE